MKYVTGIKCVTRKMGNGISLRGNMKPDSRYDGRNVVIIAICVRWPGPISVLPETHCTLPSALMITWPVAGFDPPPWLHLCGDPAALAAPAIAIVGSRRPTPAGRAVGENSVLRAELPQRRSAGNGRPGRANGGTPRPASSP